MTVAVTVPSLMLVPVIQLHRTWPEASAVVAPFVSSLSPVPAGRYLERDSGRRHRTDGAQRRGPRRPSLGASAPVGRNRLR
jgi:hypothetical protein